MDQTRALNALAPFLALAKSANSPRAAADLITQATSATNTYIFAELLQQPNIRALAGHEQYGSFHTLLECFAWGTWESYQATPNLPNLSDAQTLKLRLLSLLTIASTTLTTPTQSTLPPDLSYTALSARLGLTSTIDLEHLAVTAIYQDLLHATLDPARGRLAVSSVAALRDPAPGRVAGMRGELAAWADRCGAAERALEAEIRAVRERAERTARDAARLDRSVRAVLEGGEKGKETGAAGAGGAGSGVGGGRGGVNLRGSNKRESVDDGEEDDEDLMDVDGGTAASGGGRKKALGSAAGGLFSKLGRGSKS